MNSFSSSESFSSEAFAVSLEMLSKRKLSKLLCLSVFIVVLSSSYVFFMSVSRRLSMYDCSILAIDERVRMLDFSIVLTPPILMSVEMLLSSRPARASRSAAALRLLLEMLIFMNPHRKSGGQATVSSRRIYLWA